MVSFQRMKEELDDFGLQVTNKLPVVGRTGCLLICVVAFVIIFVIAFAIGYGSKGGVGQPIASPREATKPYFVFVSNNSHSCPPLVAERLITTVERGDSFEGLVVNLACRGDYNPFPNQVKCRRKSIFDNQEPLEWSNVPICYPSVLVSKEHWSKVLHARSVSCSGDSGQTQCELSCIRDYIAVEDKPYRCSSPPCPAWTLGDAQCYMCDQKCEEMHALANPRAGPLLQSLTCTPSCDKILVHSDGKAAIWQNGRTGLFRFVGEHNGRPVYQNNATKEFLFYTFTGSQWLVGPDFRKPHAGIQMFGNDNTFCPEKNGGANVSRLYIDSSEPSPGGTGKWTSDETLDFKCLADDYQPVECECQKYKVYNLVYPNGTVPSAVEYLTGNFTKMNGREIGLLAPLYFDEVKQLYLFSHHPQGKVWQISSKLSTTPMRGVIEGPKACPDSVGMTWEWFNTTTPQGQQIYVPDKQIQVKCVKHASGSFPGA